MNWKSGEEAGKRRGRGGGETGAEISIKSRFMLKYAQFKTVAIFLWANGSRRMARNASHFRYANEPPALQRSGAPRGPLQLQQFSCDTPAFDCFRILWRTTTHPPSPTLSHPLPPRSNVHKTIGENPPEIPEKKPKNKNFKKGNELKKNERKKERKNPARKEKKRQSDSWN